MKWSAITGAALYCSSLVRFVPILVIPTILALTACRSPDMQSPDAGAVTTTPEVAPSQSAGTSSTEMGGANSAEGDPKLQTHKPDSDVRVDASFDAASDAELAADALDDRSIAADAESDAGPPPACPPEMTHIGRYCVDRWEAHLVTKNSDGTTSLWPHHARPENGVFIAQSTKGIFPQAYISRVEAKAACNQAGKRLCSRAEWMRACKGSRGFRYPYGNQGKRGACNTGKAHLLYTFFGAKRGGWSYENFNDPKLDQEPGFLAKSGDYETCHSNEDVYDIVGNLHEWINDDVGTDIEQVLEKDGVERKEQPWRAGNGMFMGGFFSTTVEHGPGCTYTTIAHEPTYHDYSTGFRCCKTATLPDKPTNNKGKSKK